jgi:hypothetical protein
MSKRADDGPPFRAVQFRSGDAAKSLIIKQSLTRAGPRCLIRGSFEGQVAQLVEQRTENPRVGGSIPSLATKISLSSRNLRAERFLRCR